MSNFIAWGGSTGSSMVMDVHSPQAFGTLQVFGAGYVIGSTAARYVNQVTDSKGGTWVSDSRRIGTNTATDPNNNTLSSGPSFIRTDALGTNDLRNGDQIAVQWDGSCHDNIAVCAQLGGIKDTLPTQYDGLSLGFGSLSPIADAPYDNNFYNAAGNGSAFSASYSREIALASANLAELISFCAIQPGWTRAGCHYGTTIDLYVSNSPGAGQTPGTLTIGAAQRNVRSYFEFDPGWSVSSNGSAPFDPNIILVNYQIYDDPLFFNSSPGPASIGVSSSPPLFIGHTKSRKH